MIALTGLNMNERTYTISFMEGETLHLTTTEGEEKLIGYYDTGDIPGAYNYTTTTSGTIKAYTTIGSMTSETVTMDVVCEPIVLPMPTYNIVSASEGYEKTYQFTVDNSAVEMQPEIFSYIDGDSCVFEKNVMPRLADEGQMAGYFHDGFWQCMDTQREKQKLEELWAAGAPWKLWE